MIRDLQQEARARRLRWFGVDRTARVEDRWFSDIDEVGYKYQMTDIAAAMGLASLLSLDDVLAHRRRLFDAYRRQLASLPCVELVGGQRLADREHAACYCVVHVHEAADLRKRLAEHGIESAPMHQRNDRYGIFAGCGGDLPVMDALEGHYLALPFHTKLSVEDVERICHVIRS